jgi:hypothetical protein
MYRRVGATIACLCCLTFPVVASANAVYATGFEPPSYTTGALAGQGGWIGSPGIVETATVFAGTQAVGFDATGVSGQANNFTPVPSAGQGSVERATDEFFVSASDSNVFWEVLAVDGNAGFLGQLVVHNDHVQLGLASTAVGSVAITAGAWHSYTMDFNFSTDVQTAYVDGTLIGSGAFATPSTLLTGLAVGINFANGAATSQAYADNLLIDAPEPSSLVLMGSGLAALGVLMLASRSMPGTNRKSRDSHAV